MGGCNLKSGTGICLVVTGIICLSLCLVIHFERESFVNYEVNNTILVDSPDSPSYDAWVDGCSGDLPYIYQSFWFYNLTNYHEVIYSVDTIPNFEKVGPYTYKECQVKEDVTFSDDGNKVRFSTNYTFHWMESMSEGSEDDIIINLNQPELVAATYMGNAQILYGAPLFAYYEVMSKYFNEVFPQYALNQYGIGRLTTKETELTEASYTQTDIQEAWANGTKTSLGAEYDIFKGVLLSVYNDDVASGVSAESASMLWSKTTPDSLFDSSWEAQTLWLNAENGRDFDGVNARTTLQETFLLTNDELLLILTWRNETKFNLIPDFLAYINELPEASKRANKVNTLSDVGALQWATGAVTKGDKNDAHDTVYDYPPHETKEYIQNFHLGLDTSKRAVVDFIQKAEILIPSWFAPEMSYFESLEFEGTVGASWTVNEYNNLFGKDGFLVNKDSFGKYFACNYLVKNGNVAEKGACRALLLLHLTGSQENDLSIYNWKYLYPLITPVFCLPATGLGLIDARTAHERLWFGPLGIGGGNQTIRDWNTTFYTGKSDISLSKQIVEWEDQSYLCSYNGPECTFFEGYWPIRQNISRTDGPVSGDGTQYPPGTGEDPDAIVYTWDSDILRTVLMAYDGEVDVKGVRGHRYLIDNTTLDADAGYDQANMTGIANMTHLATQSTGPIVDKLNEVIAEASGLPFSGVDNETALLPVFLTFADHYLADPKYAETVSGLDTDFLTDTIYIVIEPTTGSTIEAQKQLAYNLLLDEKYQTIFDSANFYHNITEPFGEVMWPVAVLDEHGTLNSKTADELSFLQDFPATAKWALYVGVPFFSVLIILGGALTFFGCRAGQQEDYEVLGSLN